MAGTARKSDPVILREELKMAAKGQIRADAETGRRRRHSGERCESYGPKGRNVILEKSFGAQITKDGVTVAKTSS